MKIALILARGRSKRIKNKNIRVFINKPIISVTIGLLKRTKIFDKIYVSTDSKKIAKISKHSGAEVPFLRNKKYASDTTTTNQVVTDFVKKMEKEIDLEYICCVYPTSVFIKKKYLMEGYRLLSKKFNFVFSATKHSYPIQRSFFVKNKRAKMLNAKAFDKRTQDFKETYHDAAQFYWAKKNAWKKKKFHFNNNCGIVELPSNSVQDIDNISDWNSAIIKFRQQKK